MLWTIARALHALLYVAAAVGCLLVLYSGRRERHGDLAPARRIARLGGFVMAGATLLTMASGPAVLALGPRPSLLAGPGADGRALVLLAAGAVLTLLAGFVGLLAGLSGKPRPSGYFAAILLAAAVLTLLAATRSATLASRAGPQLSPRPRACATRVSPEAATRTRTRHSPARESRPREIVLAIRE